MRGGAHFIMHLKLATPSTDVTNLTCPRVTGLKFNEVRSPSACLLHSRLSPCTDHCAHSWQKYFPFTRSLYSVVRTRHANVTSAVQDSYNKLVIRMSRAAPLQCFGLRTKHFKISYEYGSKIKMCMET